MSSERKIRQVLIIYTPPRDSFDGLRTFTLNELEADARQYELASCIISAEPDLLDRALSEQRWDAVKLCDYLIQHRGLKVADFSTFWFAGNGSSSFAREMMRYAFVYNRRIADKMGENALLRPILRSYLRYRIKGDPNEERFLLAALQSGA